jgi:hypothetical protein
MRAGTTDDRTAGLSRRFGAVGKDVRTKRTKVLRSYGLSDQGRWHAMARVSDHCTRRENEEISDAVVEHTMLWSACHRVSMGLI